MARHVVPQQGVLVHGFYGEGNVGDEAILGATLNLLDGVGVPATVVATNPGAVSSEWGVRSLSGTARERAKAAALLRTQAYVLGGGGLIKDFGAGSQSIRRWLEWLRRAHRVGVPTMLWSIGVGNLDRDESRWLVRERLREVDVITVRDAASAERLRAIGVEGPVHVTADPVPALVRRHRRADGTPVAGPPVVAVSLRHWYARAFETADAAVFERFLDETARALDHLAAAHGATFVLVPFRTVERDDDRDVLRRLVNRMHRASAAEIVMGAPSVQDVVERLAQTDVVVGMRLHAAVVSSALGIPTVAIEYMPKVGDYMAEIGQSAHVAPLAEVNSDWLIAQVEDALAHAEDRRRVLEAATDRLADRFLLNGQLLQGLLSRRA